MLTEYRFYTGAQWGIKYREQVGRTEVMPDPEAVLHHTAGNPWHTISGPEAFRRLNQMALDSGLWCVVYDILVHEQRVSPNHKIISIGEGRGPWMSAATLDRNEQAEAVCALGYFHPGHQLSAHPSPEMLEGIARAFFWGMEKGWISRSAEPYGHRDNPSHPGNTGCPGDFLWPHLPLIRSRIKELLSREVIIVNNFQFRPDAVVPRFLDTRGPADNFDKFKVPAGQVQTIKIPSAVGKSGVKVNVTVTHGNGPGFMTLWRSGPVPTESKINWVAGQTIANEVTVPITSDGKFNFVASVPVHVIMDLVGYYVPDA